MSAENHQSDRDKPKYPIVGDLQRPQDGAKIPLIARHSFQFSTDSEKLAGEVAAIQKQLYPIVNCPENIGHLTRDPRPFLGYDQQRNKDNENV